MYSVLVIGAGMVCRPLVQYLLKLGTCKVTLVDNCLSKADAIVAGDRNGTTIALDVTKAEGLRALDGLVSHHDLSVSLLPYALNCHCKVADFCIKHKKHMVTTSYVSEDMQKRDAAARGAGIIILNECGLDPGIDHMSAMQVIHAVQEKGGKVISFRSNCGAIPSPRSATNPFGYQFSWSPRGVLLASRNPASWLQDGAHIAIPGPLLFENYKLDDVPGYGTLENYPNRDAVPYKTIYGLNDAETVYRGTYRNIGWCETLRAIAALGWLDQTVCSRAAGFTGSTYGDLTRFLLKVDSEVAPLEAAATKLGLYRYSAAIKRIEWLGLFGDSPLEIFSDDTAAQNCPLDHLNHIMMEKIAMGPDDVDMVVMHHEFVVEFGAQREHITATMIEFGEKGGDTAVARTVALPAAIAIKNILSGAIKEIGVKVPVDAAVYEPIMGELGNYGVHFVERHTAL